MDDEAPLAWGLRRIEDLWRAQGAGLVTRRLEGALGCTFQLTELGGETYHLQLSRESATWGAPSGSHVAHAEVKMSRPDWARVLTGEWSIIAVVLAGRAPYPKHQRRYLMQLSMVLQTLLLAGGRRS